MSLLFTLFRFFVFQLLKLSSYSNIYQKSNTIVTDEWPGLQQLATKVELDIVFFLTEFKMATIGPRGLMAPIDQNIEDWHLYTEQFNHYCDANGTAADKKLSSLLSIGSKIYQLIKV